MLKHKRYQNYLGTYKNKKYLKQIYYYVSIYLHLLHTECIFLLHTKAYCNVQNILQ